MKEHMADYIDIQYIFLQQHYRTRDPLLWHWGRSDIILYACVYGPHGDLLTWIYKHSHDSLMRYLINVHLYDVVMYFHDLSFVPMMFGRVQYRQWDLGIDWFHLTWSSSWVVGLINQTNL